MTKIYGTLGPACAGPDRLEQMLRLGMTGVRLNLSHRSLRDSAPQISALREAARRCGAAAELIMDTQGPEVRIGVLAAPLTLIAGQEAPAEAIPLPAAVKERLAPGQELLLDDGRLLLRAETGNILRVIRGGVLHSRKSVALPGTDIDLPPLTEEDLANISLAGEYGVTGLMQPFVRSRDDLEAVRAALKDAGAGHLRLYAKVENAAGVERLAELLPAADEIVIARGDLGNAMPLWRLPAVQKRIAAVCRRAGKPFMVVTQLLGTMEHSAVPTRAEVSDVFNAVLDGAASVMVTGETAVGEYPVEVIRYLANTVRQAELYSGQQ